ncbi:MAG: MarR family transcriptional regulator [Pseudomonadota bacterium]
MSDYQKILIALRKITRAIDLNSKKLVRTSGVTGPQLLVMRVIDREARTKPSVIAKNVQLSQATVTTILDRLERSGYVRRERSLTDRRVVEVELTTDGVDKLRNAPELLQAGFFKKFDALEDWERSLLTSSLQRIALMMDADDIDASPILELGDLAIDNETAR